MTPSCLSERQFYSSYSGEGNPLIEGYKQKISFISQFGDYVFQKNYDPISFTPKSRSIYFEEFYKYLSESRFKNLILGSIGLVILISQEFLFNRLFIEKDIIFFSGIFLMLFYIPFITSLFSDGKLFK